MNRGRLTLSVHLIWLHHKSLPKIFDKHIVWCLRGCPFNPTWDPIKQWICPQKDQSRSTVYSIWWPTISFGLYCTVIWSTDGEARDSIYSRWWQQRIDYCFCKTIKKSTMSIHFTWGHQPCPFFTWLHLPISVPFHSQFSPYIAFYMKRVDLQQSF